MTEQEQMERFAKIVREGGEILVASDIKDSFPVHLALAGAGAFAVRVRVEPWLAPGTVCAVSRRQLEQTRALRPTLSVRADGDSNG